MDTLRTAVFEGRRLRMRYLGTRGAGGRTVDPWGLVFKPASGT